MPPEPVPWDRKDVVSKDRKHEGWAGSDALGGGGGSSSSRWRDPFHGPRDFPRASPRRPPSGHYRQGGGGYHQLYPEDSGGHGCTPSRSDRIWLEDESFRPSGRYGGGRSGGRDSRMPFRRSPYWDSFPEYSRQQQPPLPQIQDSAVTSLRSVAVPISPASQPPLKDENDRIADATDDGSGTGRRVDPDRSLGSMSWKPLKWPRASSLSVAKVGRSEQEEAGLEVSAPSGKETLVSTATSPQLADDGAPRKKARLGWGQGLAKYEKQKVQGSLDSPGTGARSATSDTSPRMVTSAGFPSPATPSSATCCSSPGMEEKPCVRSTDSDNDTHHHSASGPGIQPYSEIFSIKLDDPEVNPITSLTTLLVDLLQPEDVCSGDSTFTRDTSMGKLLQLKGEISKELEKTECEIDLLEGELKSLDCDGRSNTHQCSSTLPLSNACKSCLRSSDGISNDSILIEAYKITSSIEKQIGEHATPTSCFEERGAEVKEVEMSCPDTISPKCEELASLEKTVCCSDEGKLAEDSVVLDDDRFKVLGAQESIPFGVQDPASMSEHRNVNCVEEEGNSDFTMNSCSNSKTNNYLISLIMADNHDAAKRASQVFAKVFPSNLPQFDLWGSVDFLSDKRTDLKIKEKLTVRKHQQKFKEQVLTLKFRALHHLWKEDLRLLSIRKQRTKSNKRFDLTSRSLQSGSQKQRSSIRSRFALPAGNLTLVPTTEIVDFTSKLLSDSQIKPYRSNLKMPALILDDQEKRHMKFINQNGLIEDPVSFEKEKAMINPWSQEEREIFLDMLATCGKDFTKISSFISHKTTADCIEFYYKNHKSESFREVKKCLDLRKQWQRLPTSTYLVTSGKKWNREMNAASLDMLGEASVVAAHNHGSGKSNQRYAGASVYQTNHDLKVSHGCYGSIDRRQSVEGSVHERESVAADVLAGICGALSSEAMSSCITSSTDPREKLNYMATERPLTLDVNQNIYEEETSSDEGCGELESVDWTDEEKSIFVRALSMHGKDFTRISRCVGTRSPEQCKIFFSKARKCLGLDVIHKGSDDVGIAAKDTNGGRSDTDDGGAAEMDSAICSTQSCSKIDGDVSQSMTNATSEELVHAGNALVQHDTDRLSEQDVVGVVNHEEYDTKVEKQECVRDDKLSCEGANSQPNTSPKESAAADLNCNKSLQHVEVAEKVVTETKIGGSSIVVPPTGQIISANQEVRSNFHTVGANQQKDSVGAFSTDGMKKEVSSHQVILRETGLKSRRRASIDLGTSSSGSLWFVPVLGSNGSAFDSGNAVDVCSRPSPATSYERQVPLDLLPCLQKKPPIISLKQEDCQPVQFNSVFPDSSHLRSEVTPHVASQTTMNFEENGSEQCQSSVRDLYQPYMLTNSSLNQVDQSVHILKGYPLQILNHKEIKREPERLVSESPLFLEKHLCGNGSSQSNQFFVSNMQYDKYNSSSLSHSCSGNAMLQRSEHKVDNQTRLASQHTSPETEEQSQRTGDVKLFGKILSHPLSLQKSSTSLNETKSQPPSPKTNKSSSMQSSSIVMDGSLLASMPGSSVQLGREELPVRSYGFWDGSRIQTGFSSLPECALMLAKYQRSRAEVSLYSKDGVPSSNTVRTDYQQPFMQQLSSDGKKLDSFTDLQKRNGIEIVSGFQQSGRETRLGANMVGSGGILGGGVSDPVAVLKMHYASSAKVRNEGESWRGDIKGR
ncbi:uncharacterized protein [Typha angustifolia]|uniref:uncharacterized protein isoform X1 n=1 Tax=Typha angustifolia TaxID=59011 RepID=UPI003C2BE347